MPTPRKPARATIMQVARRAGVSIKTVSRVSNGEPNVRPELRARVMESIQALGYHPSLAARSLAGRRSFLLALVYDNPSPSYLLNVQAGALAACHERGYHLLFHPCEARGPQFAAELLALREDPGVDGLVLSPPLSGDRDLLRALRAAQVPHALIAPPERQACAVVLDDEAAAVTLTAHLLELGHRRIAFISGHPQHAASVQRQRGYERALRQARLEVDRRLVQPGDFTFDSGRRAARALLARRRGRPTAIVASNDDMAAGVIAEAHAAGFELPRELSVAGFDDAPLAAVLWPPLTTMHQPIAAMSAQATRQLLDVLCGTPPAVAAPPLAFSFVRRASTCPP
jgi:LacI family transcriptional regulator